MSVEITTADNKITVTAPYDPAFPAAAKQNGGKWDASKKAWQFDVRDEDKVRALCREVYGTDGTDNDGPRLTLRIPVPFGPRSTGDEFRPAGQRLVWRPGRDMPVRYAPGVVLVAGDFPHRGGSVRNPELDPEPGTVIEVRDLPAGTARKILDTVDGAEVVGDLGEARRAELIAEREQLLARLAKIAEELGESAA